MNKCLNCQNVTKNPKFCSRSCAASFNNTKIHKRKPGIRFCKYCGKELEIIRYEKSKKVKPIKVCDSCNFQKKDWNIITKQDIQKLRKYQVNSRIRELARDHYYKLNLPKVCKICGYVKHIEICHIKSIASFNNLTPISEINSIDNLVALCPNHHWELDNNLLRL